MPRGQIWATSGVHRGCIGGASGGPAGGHREGTSGALFSDFPENASGPAKLAKNCEISEKAHWTRFGFPERHGTPLKALGTCMEETLGAPIGAHIEAPRSPLGMGALRSPLDTFTGVLTWQL